MKINVNNNNSLDTSNYLDNDNLYVGYNSNSGYSYIYLENSPHLSLCKSDFDDTLCIVYSSSLDGTEFKTFNIPDSLSLLEDLLSDAYSIEEEIRGDNYNDSDLTDKFIEAMEAKSWELI